MDPYTVRHRRFAARLTLLGALCAVACPRARAEMGTVEIPESELPEESAPAPAISVPEAKSEASLAVIPPEPSSLDGSWLMNTAAGPTAFVLDRKQLQFGAESGHTQRLLGAGSPTAVIRYGIAESLTLGGFYSLFSPGSIFFDPRWNFLNHELDSWAVGPWIGYRPRRSQWGSQTSSGVPLGIELAFSHVYDDWHKLHLTATVGTYDSTSTYSSYVYQYDGGNGVSGESNSTVARFVNARAAAAYELRLGRNHGWEFSLASELGVGSQDQSYTEIPGYGPEIRNGFSSTSRRLEINLGTAYHLFIGRFDGHIGVEGGFQSQAYGESAARYSYSSFGLANASASLDYRF